MRTRWTIVAAAAAVLLPPAPAKAVTTCTWAGTALEPTGWFTLEPGLTNTPSTGPLEFHATGELGGDCGGRMRFDGVFHSGASCRAATFSVKVRGLKGVAAGEGVAANLLPAPTLLYDRGGNLVGHEAASLITQDNVGRFAGLPCSTDAGVTGASFHSVVVLYD